MYTDDTVRRKKCVVGRCSAKAGQQEFQRTPSVYCRRHFRKAKHKLAEAQELPEQEPTLETIINRTGPKSSYYERILDTNVEVVDWEMSFGTSGTLDREFGEAVTQTSDGGFIAVGGRKTSQDFPSLSSCALGSFLVRIQRTRRQLPSSSALQQSLCQPLR